MSGKLSFSDVAAFHVAYSDVLGAMRVWEAFCATLAGGEAPAAPARHRGGRLQHPDDYELVVDAGVLRGVLLKPIPSGYFALDVLRPADGHSCTEAATRMHCDLVTGDVLLASDGTIPYASAVLCGLYAFVFTLLLLCSPCSIWPCVGLHTRGHGEVAAAQGKTSPHVSFLWVRLHLSVPVWVPVSAHERRVAPPFRESGCHRRRLQRNTLPASRW